jgi:hypothetical protein
MAKQDRLETFRREHAAYARARLAAERARHRRDRALLAASKGRSVRELAKEVKLSAPRVQQLLERARRG